MRRESIKWTYMVLSLILVIYGLYFVISGAINGKEIPVMAIVALAFGGLMLIIYTVLIVVDAINKKLHKNDEKVEENKESELKLDLEEEKVEVQEPKKVEIIAEKPAKPQQNQSSYIKKEKGFTPCYGYISELGQGIILEINGYYIRDMRDNRYYRIDGNYVYSESGGLSYIIEGNVIKSISRGYLYEICGSGVYKTYGGYYASFSGGHISIYDNSKIYSYSDSLTTEYKLAIAVILFGEY